MHEMILCKLGEVVLKGLNRRSFEMKLMSNLRRRTARFGRFRVYSKQSTIYVEPAGEACDLDGAYDACKRVFGIIAVARALPCAKEKEAILDTAKTYLSSALTAARSFKVESKRADKTFPMTSPELMRELGAYLLGKHNYLKVDVHNPDFKVIVEIRDYGAYIHGPKVPGEGGLPVGTSGRALNMLSGGIDSPVSSYMIAKRGVRLIPVHFFSFPYTSELAKEKVISLAKELTAYTGRMTLQIVPFTHIQEEIRRACPEEYFTLIMRRFMMRIAEDIAAHNECKAIVTGENLGQVASQTMEAMACTQAVTHLPVLQPLIGMDKRDIVKIARDIGTFDTSILPYEDCCTVFTPRHPKTRPTVAEVAEAEAALDIDALVREAVDGIERIRIDL